MTMTIVVVPVVRMVRVSVQVQVQVHSPVECVVFVRALVLWEQQVVEQQVHQVVQVAVELAQATLSDPAVWCPWMLEQR